MKKGLCILTAVLIILTAFSGCSKKDIPTVKLGLVTNGKSFEDDPFNCSAWSGIIKASEKIDCKYTYKEPSSADTKGFSDAISELYKDGCRMIVAPDETISAAIKESQKRYPDCRFICLGFTISDMTSNTLCISFSEVEEGFIAGVAAAVQIESGSLGCIFGMDTPSTERLAYGFIQGAKYANINLGTTVTVNDERIIYIGSYNDPDLAKKIAAELYSSGTAGILTDGGNSSHGVYEAAKERTNAWVLGCGVDRNSQGVSENGRSVTLTSAVGVSEVAIKKCVEAYYNSTFEGKKIITLTSADDAIGLSASIQNLNSNVISTCNNIIAKLKNKEIILNDPTALLK